MRKRIKSVVAVGLSLALAVSAAGCGKREEWKRISIRILL